jgi:hypothetical protein
MRNQFAIGVADALRFVDEDAQDAAVPASEELHLDDLDIFRLGNPLRNLGDSGGDGFPVPIRHAAIANARNKKVGFRPLVAFDIISIPWV